MNPFFLFSIIDFLGVFVAAFGGAIAARRDQRYAFDLVGVLGLGFVSALGGGICRDLLIQHGPPLAFVDTRYLVTAFCGATAGLMLDLRVDAKLQGTLMMVDAAALGLFAVAGATRAMEAGLSSLPALLLGLTTAVGGGSLRDVLSGRTPKVFEKGELYAIVATVAATVFVLLRLLSVNHTVASCVGVGCGFLLRLLTIRFHWMTKSASIR
jgi:uncharacterized membrane protein YeiH